MSPVLPFRHRYRRVAPRVSYGTVAAESTHALRRERQR